MDILPEHRTSTARIIAQLERPESNETSVGKQGTGVMGQIAPYAQAIISAIGGARTPLRAIPGGQIGPRNLTPAQRAHAVENHEFNVIPGGGRSEASTFAGNRFLNDMTERIMEALSRRQEVMSNPHHVHSNYNIGNPYGSPSGLMGDRAWNMSINPRHHGLDRLR